MCIHRELYHVVFVDSLHHATAVQVERCQFQSLRCPAAITATLSGSILDQVAFKAPGFQTNQMNEGT